MQAGDGDCGATVRTGAEALLDALPCMDLDDLRAASDSVSKILLRSMGGTSGALYSILFAAAARAFDAADQAGPTEYARALQLGCDAVMAHGGAELGDRSMVDALYPAAQAASKAPQGAFSCSSSNHDPTTYYNQRGPC